MRIAVLDGYTTNPGDLSWEWLSQYGTYKIFDFTKPEEIVERTRDCEIVFTNKTVLGADVLSEMKALRYVGLLSTGYNAVDIDFAAKLGVPVTNIPSYSTAAVAQMTFAHILEWTNRVGLHDRAVKDGDWVKDKHFCFWKSPLTELNNKTLGIIGFGSIGQAVANIAYAFGMNVIANTPHPDYSLNSENFRFAELDELLNNSDFVSMHCPLTSETEKMANASFFAKMKPTAYFINTSRGGVVDEGALINALNDGIIAGAGLDVMRKEPPEAGNPLLSSDKCHITPHIAWAGFETRKRLMGILHDNLRAFTQGKPINVVNRPN